MTDDLKQRAMALFTPPFRYYCGYIQDREYRMVADKHDKDLRVRGWGRISYMPDAAALQDAAGAIIAEALTEFWERRAPTSEADQRARFEAAAYEYYLQRHADGKTADRHGMPMDPHQLFWRQPNGEYGVLMFNSAWWGWQKGREA